MSIIPKSKSTNFSLFRTITSLIGPPEIHGFYQKPTVLPPLSTVSPPPKITSLTGPPEIHRSDQKPTVSPPTSTVVSDPFMDAMVANFNSISTSYNPPMGYTENMSPTYLNSGNPCLDFFFHVVPGSPTETINRLLVESWKHDPLKTLKLICNLRGVRGKGKSDKEGYYTSALWLHKNHPKTLACNLPSMAEFGYFKDLPEILYRLLQGPDVRQKAKREHQKRLIELSRPSRIRVEIDMEKVNAIRKQKKIAMAKKAIERFNRDPDYRFLHDRVSDFFANLLRADIKNLADGKWTEISLAAKWCPSIDSSFDRSTLLYETIAKKVFPREEYTEYDGVEEAHYTYRVRDRLRKQILVPLRKALQLPEVYIGQNQWGLIPYNRVASVAMDFYKEKFLKHDKERFEEYLQKVESGEAKIAAGALLPHEIIKSLDDVYGDQIAELQWKRMVDDMLEKGKLNNCLAVCDVSASMIGRPMEVCVALGLLVSELSEEPWKGKVITFCRKPEMHIVKGDDLRSKTEFVRTMYWGVNTNFQKVFDLILEVAVKAKLSEKDMIKRVFVFSDMEFDQASSSPWETDYQVIKRKFMEKGYGESVPEIVFWNLRNSRSTPVAGDEKGVALVSGFSKNMIKLFMEDDLESLTAASETLRYYMTPEGVMERAISGDEYKKLVVFD